MLESILAVSISCYQVQCMSENWWPVITKSHYGEVFCGIFFEIFDTQLIHKLKGDSPLQATTLGCKLEDYTLSQDYIP